MAGNNIYVQGSYIDVHDNEVVNLSVNKAQVRLGDGQQTTEEQAEAVDENEELFHFVHPELDETESWRIHDAVKRIVKLQGIQMICQYLVQLKDEHKVLLPQGAEKAYNELIRLGMSSGEGYSLKTFMKYYKR